MLFKGTNGNDILEGTDKNDTLKGNAGDDDITGNDGDDLLNGGAGDDSLYGGSYEGFFSTESENSDTLTGGKGQDAYLISLTASGGSVIKDESANDDNFVMIFAENIDLEGFEDLTDLIDFQSTIEALDFFEDPNTWGDAAIELSRPEKGIVGLEKSSTSLIIDINRDGVAEASDDLTITNYFDDQGDLGKGTPAFINNIVNQQDIVDFFA
jgi:RTX calcium-binding nonapeptide repeat (4 copies)